MTPFRLKIVAPDKEFFDGETERLVVRTTEGDKGILANHISYVANLNAGPLKVMLSDGSFKTAAISSGALKVGNNQAVILATAIEWADEIDVERAIQSKADAEERMRQFESGKEFDRANLKLQRALNRITVAGK